MDALAKHALGEVEMAASQVTAGLGLLRKKLPDLSAIGQDPSAPPLKAEVVVRFGGK